jgi:plasmid stabilization system protein ParE
MAAELILAPEAEEDLVLAYAWMEARRLGLGEDFPARVDACLQSVRRNPLYPVVHEEYRRALVRRFPYAVFYEHTEQRVLVYC